MHRSCLRPINEIRRRLVIVVRDEPEAHRHRGEACDLAEVALERGFDDVRIVAVSAGSGGAAGLAPGRARARGITVERPRPVSGRAPDEGGATATVGRLVELFTDAVPTVCLSPSTTPHAAMVTEALNSARATGLPTSVITMAGAVGSDISGVIGSFVAAGRSGVATHLLASFLAHDHCLAVSEHARDRLIEAAECLDLVSDTEFAEECRRRVRVSYPPIDSTAFVQSTEHPSRRAETDRVLAARALRRDSYVLCRSRRTDTDGVDDLIDAYGRTVTSAGMPLVIVGEVSAGRGTRDRAVAGPARPAIRYLDDVSAAERRHLMAGCAAYVQPVEPASECIETLGIGLVEKMLSGGGPVITTATGGIVEVVGDAAIIVEPGDVDALAAAIDAAVVDMEPIERRRQANRAKSRARRFDRQVVFDDLLVGVDLAALDRPQTFGGVASWPRFEPATSSIVV